MDTLGIKDILTDIGFSLKDYGKEYRAKPIYRDSDNNTVLSIKKDTGRWIDFKDGTSGNFEDLIKLSLNLNTEDVKKYLEKRTDFSIPVNTAKPQVTSCRVFSEFFLDKIKKDNSYWNNRGVSDETLNVFKGGVCESGKMKGRYVFPIYNLNNKLVGVSGRDVFKSSTNRPKWKHIGNKAEWQYPVFLNQDEIKIKKEIILVESIGDMLALWDSGVYNSMVIFGLSMGAAVFNLLLRLDPSRIILSLNNDSSNEFAGNNAANKIKEKLKNHFDEKQLKVSLPTRKDFGEMTKEEISLWYKNLNG